LYNTEYTYYDYGVLGALTQLRGLNINGDHSVTRSLGSLVSGAIKSVLTVRGSRKFPWDAVSDENGATEIGY